jgi:carnitine-CoA ligase
LTIPLLLRQRAAEAPRSPFIVNDRGSFSFERIDAAVDGFAGKLSSLGVRAGSHVAIAAGNSAGYLVAWIGINRAGGVAVTLNVQAMGESLRYMINQCEVTHIVADEAWMASHARYLDDRQRALPTVLIGDEVEFVDSAASGEKPTQVAEVKSSDPATIMFTSGTTGLPKGVVNCHAAYEAVGRHTADMLALTSDDRCMVVLPLFHANPQMYAVMSALHVGSALILRERFSASAFFEDARKFAATGFTFVGTILSVLASRHSGTVSNHALRFGVGGGAPIRVWRDFEERFNVTVQELYGMTEIGGWVTGNTVSDRRIGTCGRSRPDMEVIIVDENDHELGPGVPGEIVVRPREPGVILLGYYRQPDLMLEACRNLWFHTGDRGSLDEEGYLYFLGRIKELIRRGGEMVSPVEIETALRKMPGIEDCAVVGVDDEILGQEIKAVVVAREAQVPPEAVRDFLSKLVPAYMLPRYVEFVEAVPKTETEKIQRHKIVYIDARVHDLGRY